MVFHVVSAAVLLPVVALDTCHCAKKDGGRISSTSSSSSCAETMEPVFWLLLDDESVLAEEPTAFGEAAPGDPRAIAGE